MGLKNLDIDEICSVLEEVLKPYFLFSDFILEKRDIQKIKSPKVLTEYNFTFISEEKNRWIFIRIEDYDTNQRLVIYINQNKEKQPVNIDLEIYFDSNLKIRSIKQKMVFKAESKDQLKKKLRDIFKYIMSIGDKQLNDVLEGKIWIDMPFNWGSYK